MSVRQTTSVDPLGANERTGARSLRPPLLVRWVGTGNSLHWVVSVLMGVPQVTGLRSTRGQRGDVRPQPQAGGRRTRRALMTAYRYIRTGRLAARRVGTGWTVSRTSLNEFSAGALRLLPDSATVAAEANWRERLGLTLVIGDEMAAWRIIARRRAHRNQAQQFSSPSSAVCHWVCTRRRSSSECRSPVGSLPPASCRWMCRNRLPLPRKCQNSCFLAG